MEEETTTINIKFSTKKILTEMKNALSKPKDPAYYDDVILELISSYNKDKA